MDWKQLIPSLRLCCYGEGEVVEGERKFNVLGVFVGASSQEDVYERDDPVVGWLYRYVETDGHPLLA